MDLRDRKFSKFVAVLFMFGALQTTAFAQDNEDIPLVDGTMWLESGDAEKVSYIIGAGNFMTVEYVFQHKIDNAPTAEQTSVTRYWDALEDVTLDDLIGVIDGWYALNPDQLEVPVLVVIWNEYVETD